MPFAHVSVDAQDSLTAYLFTRRLHWMCLKIRNFLQIESTHLFANNIFAFRKNQCTRTNIEIMTRCSQEVFCTLFSVLFTFVILIPSPSYCQSKWEADPEADVDPESGFASKGTLSFKTPDLDDEDHYSDHLPSALKCDACNILVHLMSEKLTRAIEKQPSLKGNLPESQVLDILESVCSDEFNQVGIKEVKGVKRLSGPGLETKDLPGIMQGGGRWPRRVGIKDIKGVKRLSGPGLDIKEMAGIQQGGGRWPMRIQQICRYYLGDPGDEEIFDAYKEGNLKQMLCYDKNKDCNQKVLDKAKKLSKKSKKEKSKNKKTKKSKTKKSEL